MPLAPGEVIAGYTVVRQLGSGGMGAVYLVRHPRLPRFDALKLLKAEFSHDPDFSRRFLREADVVAGLSHRNIVSVLDRGEDRGQLWLTMQFVDGIDAEQALADSGGLLPAERGGAHPDRGGCRPRRRPPAPPDPPGREAGQHPARPHLRRRARAGLPDRFRDRQVPGERQHAAHADGGGARDLRLRLTGADRVPAPPTRGRTSMRSAACCTSC